MSLYTEVIALRKGSSKLLEVREKAIGGDAHALKVYTYWAFFQKMLRDIPDQRKEILKKFKAFASADAIEVTLAR